ncbi:unnamed protein product [Tetraodon nigroviridis]|uniref:Chromosome 20 SCAF14744, whole genome shotgun sequence n=1 Tax=Tetraodon nigroviridis TaxID=99883 RepID=Q4S3Z7_TETNG|nr:unnamed protein product [Tetraodon nigroviridis]
MSAWLFIFTLSLYFPLDRASLPLIINTWPFENATAAAWSALQSGGSVLDAVEKGCARCEREQCDGTVGYGGSPDETGETTLDALIMNGDTMEVGAVANLRRIKNAIGVARAVMELTEHTMLVGESASLFAESMGFPAEDLTTNKSRNIFSQWLTGNCQPNYRKVNPRNLRQRMCIQTLLSTVDPTNPSPCKNRTGEQQMPTNTPTTPSGLSHRRGRGLCRQHRWWRCSHRRWRRDDRFLPSYLAVELMRAGVDPTEACKAAISRIKRHYSQFFGAVICANTTGHYGAACNKFPGLSQFHYMVSTSESDTPILKAVDCF